MLTVKSGLDPHMIIKLKDECKSWILWGFGLRSLLKAYVGWYELTSSN
jgi:hypothetical protein